jgi:hypothetical protein
MRFSRKRRMRSVMVLSSDLTETMLFELFFKSAIGREGGWCPSFYF